MGLSLLVILERNTLCIPVMMAVATWFSYSWEVGMTTPIKSFMYTSSPYRSMVGVSEVLGSLLASASLGV
jgi:hypothetical protein